MEVASLFTTVSEGTGRVAVHEVRADLLEAQAPREWAGQQFDRDFVRRLPEDVDACGERGEFHTFAFAGPMFETPLATRSGEIFERDGFVYADVLSCAAC